MTPTPTTYEPASRSIAHSSATVAAWTLVSRVTGLLRVVVVGAVLGPTFFANTFLVTNTVPNLTYSVVAGPVLALVVVPAVVRAMREHGPTACAAFVRRLSSLLLGAAAAVAALLVPISLCLAWVLTISVPAADRGRAWLIAVLLLLTVAPQVVLYTVAALGAAAQQARERYALAAAAPALENVGLMVTMGAVVVLYGSGPDLGTVPLGAVLLMGIGATLSVGLHAAVQAVGAARAGLPLRPSRGWRADPAVRAVAGRLRGSIVVAALPAGATLLLLALAATVPGGVVVFQMAHLVYVVPTALGARAVTTATLPGLSAAAHAVDRHRYAAAWRQSLTYALVAGLPALCVLVVLGDAVAGTLALGELRSGATIAALGTCIAVLGVAQLAGGLHEVGRQALFSRLDVRGPQLAAAAGFAATVAGGACALLLPGGPMRLTGLCLAVLLADAVAAAVAVHRVQRAVAPEPAIDGRALAAVAAAACAMIPLLWLGRLWGSDDGGLVGRLAVLVPTVVVAAAVFALVLAVLARRRRTTG